MMVVLHFMGEELEMANVGEDKQAAIESVKAIFDALPKSKQMNFIGEFNEALVYIEHSTPGKGK